MTITRPLLAATLTQPNLIEYPVLATPKFDGIRCVKVDGKALSRSLKPIPNAYIAEHIEREYVPDGFDGELMLIGGTFQDTVSAVMSTSGAPHFVWKVFDYCSLLPYFLRAETLHTHCRPLSWIEYVKPVECHNYTQLHEYVDRCLADGYEGICFRHPQSRYKMGRSTEREQILIKWKPIETSDAVVIGFDELMRNDNPQTTNELGLSSRSHEAAGKTPAGTLGALHVRWLKKPDETFRIGTGFTAHMRDVIWASRDAYLGRVVEFKYQPIGVLDAPRCPVFVRFRENLEHLTP